MAGIEPAAYSLEGCRATIWATWAMLIYNFTIIYIKMVFLEIP